MTVSSDGINMNANFSSVMQFLTSWLYAAKTGSAADSIFATHHALKLIQLLINQNYDPVMQKLVDSLIDSLDASQDLVAKIDGLQDVIHLKPDPSEEIWVSGTPCFVANGNASIHRGDLHTTALLKQSTQENHVAICHYQGTRLVIDAESIQRTNDLRILIIGKVVSRSGSMGLSFFRGNENTGSQAGQFPDWFEEGKNIFVVTTLELHDDGNIFYNNRLYPIA